MTLPFYIRTQITTRALFLCLGNPALSRNEARRIAAHEVAAQYKSTKPNPEPRPVLRGKGNARTALIARLQALAANMRQAPGQGDSVMSHLAWAVFGKPQPQPE